MEWKKAVSGTDFVCFEARTRQLSSRIESRKVGNVWMIYKSYYNDKGLSYTEDYVAPTEDRMNQIISTLQHEKIPTVSQIQQKLLAQSKRLTLKVERDFKEYGVEKWRFGVSNGALINFVVARAYEDLDIDFVIHESYKNSEQTIIDEMLTMLGFDGMEDQMNVNVYYFSHTVARAKKPAEESMDLF
jgi:hypothetical protein